MYRGRSLDRSLWGEELGFTAPHILKRWGEPAAGRGRKFFWVSGHTPIIPSDSLSPNCNHRAARSYLRVTLRGRSVALLQCWVTPVPPVLVLAGRFTGSTGGKSEVLSNQVRLVRLKSSAYLCARPRLSGGQVVSSKHPLVTAASKSPDPKWRNFLLRVTTIGLAQEDGLLRSCRLAVALGGWLGHLTREHDTLGLAPRGRPHHRGGCPPGIRKRPSLLGLRWSGR